MEKLNEESVKRKPLKLKKSIKRRINNDFNFVGKD